MQLLYKVVKQEMNDACYYSIARWESPYFGTLAITIILFNTKVGTFPSSCAVITCIIHLLFHYFLLHRSLPHF